MRLFQNKRNAEQNKGIQLGRAARSNVAGDLTSMSAMEGTADAAAGNSGDGNISTDDIQYPAKFDSVIAVSAIDSNNATPAWSADGIEAELTAPGAGIYSTWMGGGYATSSGTSMAAPFVNGETALVIQNNAGISPNEVRAVLANNSIDLGAQGKDNVYGFGLVQAG